MSDRHHTQLSLDERIQIQKGIENGKPFNAIASEIGKDRSTGISERRHMMRWWICTGIWRGFRTGPYKRRIIEDMDECQLIPLKKAVNLRMKELFALAEKEGRIGRFTEGDA